MAPSIITFTAALLELPLACGLLPPELLELQPAASNATVTPAAKVQQIRDLLATIRIASVQRLCTISRTVTVRRHTVHEIQNRWEIVVS